MADEEQTVVDQTNTETQQSSAEGGDAQGDDLDTLLAQWEEGSQDTDSQKSTQGEQTDTTNPTQKLEQIEQIVRRQEQERVQQETQSDLQDTASKMKEAVADQMDIPADVFEELLHGRAARDNRVLNAWNSRKQDPKGWQKTATALAKDLVKRLKSDVDKSATEDREAVASAVRSASKAPSADEGPSEKDLNNMSDAEFNKLTRSLR